MDYTFTLQQNQLCDWWRTQCFVQRTKDIKVHYQLLEREGTSRRRYDEANRNRREDDIFLHKDFAPRSTKNLKGSSG